MSTINGANSLLGAAATSLALGGSLSTQSVEQNASASGDTGTTLATSTDQASLSQMGQLFEPAAAVVHHRLHSLQNHGQEHLRQPGGQG